MKRNDMNLLESYNSIEKIKKGQSKDGLLFIGITVTAFLIVGAYGLKLSIDNLMVEDRITELNVYLTSPQVAEKLAQDTKNQADLVRLADIETQVKSMYEVLDFIPVYDERILDIIFENRPDSIHYTKFNYDQNTVAIEYYEHFPVSASAFTLRLLETGIFEDVSYTGYQYDKTAGVYRGQILCIVKGGY